MLKCVYLQQLIRYSILSKTLNTFRCDAMLRLKLISSTLKYFYISEAKVVKSLKSHSFLKYFLVWRILNHSFYVNAV